MTITSLVVHMLLRVTVHLCNQHLISWITSAATARAGSSRKVGKPNSLGSPTVHQKNKVFSKICQQCAELDLFSFSHNQDDAFIRTGYDNWKNALSKFKKHASSKFHQEAVLKLAL